MGIWHSAFGIQGTGIVFAVMLLFSPAMAAPPCYSTQEAEAEQLLRLHSELMLIALTCRQSNSGRDLIKAYTQFTSRNVAKLHEAEAVMSRYYEKTAKGQGISRLDKLRTRLANECGQEMARESAPSYCAVRRDRAESLYDSSYPDIQLAAARLYARQRPGAPLCKPSLRSGLGEKKVVSPSG